MRNSDNEEFYIGYAPRPPGRIARTTFHTVVGLNALAATVALSLLFAQHPFARSTFEFQEYREFAGELEL